MKNNWFSRNLKFYPLVALIVFAVVQILYVQWNLQTYRDYANQNYETLTERMREEDVPSNIKQHIIYVQNQTTLNTSLLVSSLSVMQIFFQAIILLPFYSFYLKNNRKTTEEQQSEQ